MNILLWLATAALGGWLLLWRWLGDRWGWLGMLNAWAEWGVALLGGLGLAGLLRRQRAQSVTALGLAVVGAVHGARLPRLALLRPSGGAATEALPSVVRGKSFTLFSANLYKKSTSAAGHIALIREHQPDVVCFQELTLTQAEELGAALGGLYPYRAWRPQPDSYGLGVLSRYPVEETGYWEEPGVEPWCQRVRCALPGGAVEAYNVHLVPPTAASTLRMGMTWGFRTREEQVRLLQAEIERRGLPACIVGDHNFADGADAYRIAREPLQDAWSGVGAGPRWTWPMHSFPVPSVPWNPRVLRLDYCFHNRRLATEAIQVLTRRTGSDHCPLLVTLSVR